MTEEEWAARYKTRRLDNGPGGSRPHRRLTLWPPLCMVLYSIRWSRKTNFPFSLAVWPLAACCINVYAGERCLQEQALSR
jgi:hypothetical protein